MKKNLTDKKILVTGADGFIGSHLVEHLVALGANVRALSCYNSFNFRGWLDDIIVSDRIEIVSGDVRDAAFCRLLVKDIDMVFHLAALIAVPYSYTAPSSYIDTNVKGTLNICQAARDGGVGRFIHMSTSEVYGTAVKVPIDESHPLQPQSPYSASKIGADSVALSFFHAYGLPVVIARPFNTYGPRQSARAIIPTIITQLAGDAKQIKLGSLSPTRDFTFVTDVCRGLTELAGCDKAVGETVNLGTGTEISIGDLFKKIKNIMNSSAECITDQARVRPEKSEVHRLLCDASKMKALTGFVAETDIDRGLALTVEWFLQKDNLVRYKGNIYNV